MVFDLTDLRLQLLEPEKYPFLYKCLYGVLMLLPQSSAFAALKNRLNSVSNIGFLHGGPRRYGPCSRSPVSPQIPIPHPKKDTETVFSSTIQSTQSAFDRSTGTRLKARDENTIRWVDLLDQFKSVQERTRRSTSQFHRGSDIQNPTLTAALSAAAVDRSKERLPDAPRTGPSAPPAAGLGSGTAPGGVGRTSDSAKSSTHKHKSSLPSLGRLRIGGGKSKK